MPQEDWDDYYDEMGLTIAPQNDKIRIMLERYVPDNNGEAIEIGCFPGRYLSVLGIKGYRLSGIDLTPRVEKELPQWLKENGFEVGNFYKEDFRNMKIEDKYDIVSSFGFIEHFNDWEDIYIKHLSLVKPGGYLILTTPNFRGAIQNLLHKYVDKYNYRMHNIISMDPGKWEALALEHNFQIIYSGYYGGFDFWLGFTDNDDHIQRIIAMSVHVLARIIGNIVPVNRMYSPYCLIIAKRP